MVARQRPMQRRRTGYIMALLAAGSLLACTGVTDDGDLPPNVQDPATIQTPSGALDRYQGARAALAEAFDWFMTEGAILTDEMAALPAPLGVYGAYDGVDRRQTPLVTSVAYGRLHKARAQAREARGFLLRYAPDSLYPWSPELRAHLFAMEGYAEIFLADLFCSGIPLSTVDFDGDFTLAAGSATDEVYRHAAALFDTALALAADSTGFRHFAAIGLSRVGLALGDFNGIAAAVASVPDDYAAPFVFSPAIGGNGEQDRLFWLIASRYAQEPAMPSVADREGGNGLDYRSSGDPRIATVILGLDKLGREMHFPAKYPLDGAITLLMASGVEARLIEAEAALQAGSADWLAKLNALRTDGTFDTQPTADPDDDPAALDTLWHAGTGGVAGLEILSDPGTAASRLDLLVRERAFWLHMTGHRQGDLRRLLRAPYLRRQDAVYPTGEYLGGANGAYGRDVVVPVPRAERQDNPLYTGCLP